MPRGWRRGGGVRKQESALRVACKHGPSSKTLSAISKFFKKPADTLRAKGVYAAHHSNMNAAWHTWPGSNNNCTSQFRSSAVPLNPFHTEQVFPKKQSRFGRAFDVPRRRADLVCLAVQDRRRRLSEQFVQGGVPRRAGRLTQRFDYAVPPYSRGSVKGRL